MEKQITIRIFSLTREIYKLISKVLDKYSFIHEFVQLSDVDTAASLGEKLKDFNTNPEIIILDKEIPSALKEDIIGRYNGSSVICLPSLNESDIISAGRVNQISEPLRLSEFEKVILKLTKKDK
ncbi:MAG: hypothetical protein LWX07_07360 [Bacteroidetes bacterium]|nr:hypothetical protein [Bacteroidota bacterium]